MDSFPSIRSGWPVIQIFEMNKFEFPTRGFYLVVDKVQEADYFLELLQKSPAYRPQYRFLLSAFTTAARSITFSLQAVMSGYPGFTEWYPRRQEKLKESKISRYFSLLRNKVQKTGELPICSSFFRTGNLFDSDIVFFPIRDLEDIPEGNVVCLCKEWLIEIIGIIAECYEDFKIYVNPSEMFTSDGLRKLGWDIEDLEESLGFPRGWTDVEDSGDDSTKLKSRLRALRRYGAEEVLPFYFEKYVIKTRSG